MWTTELLSSVVNISPGNSIPAKKKSELFTGVKGIPYVGTKDVSFDGIINYDNGICIPQDYLNNFRVSPKYATLICAEGGSAGRKIAFSHNECCYVNKLFSLQPTSKIIPKFLYYYSISAEFQMQFKAALHGLIGGVSLTKMKKFAISYPSIPEQERIVAKLDAAFAEIDEAVEGSKKQETEVLKFSYRAITNTLKNLADIYSSKPLNDVVIIQPKKKLALEKISESDDVSFMGMKELGIEQKYTEGINTKPLNDVFKSYQYFEENDVVFAKITPCFENGKLGIMKNLKNGIGFGSSEFVVLRPNKEVHGEYIYYCLLDDTFRKNGTKNMSGAVGHKRVTKDYYFNYQIAVPPLSMQIECIREFDEIWKQVEIISKLKHKKINELISLKSAILKQELQSSEAA